MRIAILNEAAPISNRLNEDTCFASSDGTETRFVVADGAGQRLPTTKTAAMLNWRGTPVTAARFAALQLLNAARDYYTPEEILFQANESLAWNLEAVYETITAEAFRQHEPQLMPYLDKDPRLVRLALPVCVATAARINLEKQRLDYAHVGDTALFVFHHDGRISTPTIDRMQRYDEQALALAARIKAETNAAHLAEVLENPRVVQMNRNNGLYHNYVDEQGEADVNLGVGVINGLETMEAYMQQGSIELDGVAGVLLCTDGFLWPAPLDEPNAERDKRFQTMRERIERDGLRGYHEQLRAVEAADAARDQFPRFKIHDDCTAIFVEL